MRSPPQWPRQASTTFGPYRVADLILDDVEYGDHKAAVVLEGTNHLYTVNVDYIVMIREKKPDGGSA